ncbi:MAG TPA: hypothetical protein VKR54_01145 [Candidatus Babeliales bacterium]|nr:hypothetical protein [Candidatus Babeliales bacterium]
MAFFSPPPPPIKPPTLTVWIHGTKPDENLPPFLAKITKGLSQLLSGDIKGLHRTAELDAQHYPFYYPFLRSKALAAADPIRFNPNHFYTFGWSGKLTLKARKNAAHDLFYELKQLSTTYHEKYGCTPEIILISHSHGGNVILHLAEISDPDGFELHISKAIFLACPVQKHTAHLINSPVFERIYALHSHTDMIQIADPQGLHNTKKITRPILSLRHFNIHPKLAQATIRWKKHPTWTADDHNTNKIALKGLIKALNSLNYIRKSRGLFHVEFGLLPFVRQLPAIIDQLDTLFTNSSNCPSHKDHDLIIEL